jgi:hypothetical protein
MTTDNETKYLFIAHDFMIGDGDDYIRGSALVEEAFWVKQVAAYIEAVEGCCDLSTFTEEEKKTGNYLIAVYHNDCELEISPSDYEVQKCTLEEAQVLNKFLGGKEFKVRDGCVFTSGNWRPLLYWIRNFS